MEEMVNITPELIQELISCKKRIISEPSPKNKANGQFKQTNFLLESENKKYRFQVFICEHISLVEFFSVGLVYIPDDSTNIIILRYNGDHGEHKNKLTDKIISGFHIHAISVEAIARGLKGENEATTTTKYRSATQALIALFEDVNIINYRDYFADKLQGELFS